MSHHSEQIEAQARAFVQAVHTEIPHNGPTCANRPERVTLLFTQTLDAKTAGFGDQQVSLHGTESNILKEV